MILNINESRSDKFIFCVNHHPSLSFRNFSGNLNNAVLLHADIEFATDITGTVNYGTIFDQDVIHQRPIRLIATPITANTAEISQKRMVTLVSGQPTASKWW